MFTYKIYTLRNGLKKVVIHAGSRYKISTVVQYCLIGIENYKKRLCLGTDDALHTGDDKGREGRKGRKLASRGKNAANKRRRDG